MFKPTPLKRELFAHTLKKVFLGVFAVVVGVAVWQGLSPVKTDAAVNNTINFQARLENSAGAIVPDGYYNVEFKLYSVSTGGTAEWTEDYTYNSGSGSCTGPLGGNDCRVRVSNGYLTVNLGSVTAFPGTISWDQQQYLTMNIGGTVTSGSFPTIGDGEMSPRLKLTAVPYSFTAGSLSYNDGTNASSLNFDPQTGNNSFNLPDLGTGTNSADVCLSTGNCAGAGGGITGSGTANNLAMFTGSGAIGDPTGTVSLDAATGLTAAGALTIQSGGSADLTLDSGNSSGKVLLGTNSNGEKIVIGNEANVVNQQIDIGANYTSGSTVTLKIGPSTGAGNSTYQVGTGTLAIQGQTGATINIASNAKDQTINIGNSTGASPVTIAAGTGGLSFGANGVANTIQIGNTTGAVTQAINIGNNTTVGSTNNVTLGSLIGASATTIQGGTGNINLSTTGIVKVGSIGTATGQLYVGGVGPVDVSSGGVATGSGPSSVYVSGRYAYVADYTAAKLQIFDVSNPAAPVDVSSGGVATGSGAYSVYVSGRYAYVADSTANKLQVFDISNPASPTDVSSGGVATGSGPRSVYVSGRYAYVIDNGANKLQVFDLGGAYVQQLEAGGAEVGTLQVDSNAQFAGDASIQGGLSIGQSLQVGGNISTAGTLTANGTGNSVIMGPLGLGTANPQAGSALTVANGSWISGVDSAGTGYVNMFQVNSNNEIQVGAALNIDGGIVLPTDGGQMTFSDLPIDSSASSGTKESYTLRVGSTNALTVYGESDGAGGTQNVRVAVGSSITPGYTLDVGGDINTSGVYRVSGTPGLSSTTCSSGNYLDGASIQGGIVTGGSCVAISGGSGSGVTAVGTLDGGTVSTDGAYIDNATNKIYLQSASISDAGLVNTTTQSFAGDKTFTGATTISKNSATAFVIQNTTPTALFTADTSAMRVSIGSTTYATGQLYISGSINSTPVATIASTNGGQDNPFVQGKYLYAVSGGTSGNSYNGALTITDITNPASPQAAGSLSLGTSYPGAGVVFVAGHYAYIVTSGNSGNTNTGYLLIVDVSNPNSPTLVNTSPLSFGANSSTDNIYVSGHYAYINAEGTTANSYASKLYVVDVSNPANPVVVNTGGTAGADATNAAFTGLYVSGRYAYVAENYTGGTNHYKLLVYDVSNPASPSLVGNTSTNLTQPMNIFVQGRYAYVVNQGSSGNGNLAVFNIANPASPTYLTSASTGTGSYPLYAFIQGRYAYVTTLGTTAGSIETFDVSTPNSSITQVGSGISTGSSVYAWYPFASGRYLYVTESGTNQIAVYDLGGTYSQQLEAGGAEFGTLQIDNSAAFAGDASIQGGLNIGQSLQVGAGLSVNGVINSVSGYSINGTAGTSPSCSGGQVLSNIVVSGGIITGGSCATNGGGIAPTLQDTYNNSGTTNPQIQLSSTNGGLKVRDASSTVGNILQVQDSTGAATYFAVTSSGVTTPEVKHTGNGGDSYLLFGNTNGTQLYDPNEIDIFGSHVGIGVTIPTPGYQLDVVGDINTSTTYRVGGTAGLSSLTCSSGNYIDGATVKGGIITAGSCTSATGGGSTSTLQDAYNNSTGGTTPEIVLDSTRTSVDIQGYSGQSADLLDLRSYTASGLGTLQFGVDPSGNVTANGMITAAGGTLTGTTNINTTGSAATTIGNNSSTTTINGAFTVGAPATGRDINIGDVVQTNCIGIVGCSLTLQGSGSGSYGNIKIENGNYGPILDLNGETVATNTTSGYSALAVYQSVASSTVPVAYIQGGATPGTGADLLQFQSSSPAVLSGFNSSGQLYYKSGSNTVTLTTASQANDVTLTIPADTHTTDTLCLETLGNCSGSGVTTVGAFSGSSQTNGASISGNTITFGPADGTNPGMVSTGTQTFAGAKTFNGGITTDTLQYTSGLTVSSAGAGALSLQSNTSVSLNTPDVELGTSGSTVNVNGALQVFNTALVKKTSSSAFLVQNGSSAALLTADTSAMRVSIGSIGTATGQLYVSGQIPVDVSSGGATTGSGPQSVYVQGNYAYVVDNSASELQVFDVSKHLTPVSIGTTSTNGTPTAVFVRGHYAYVAIGGGSKLQVFDISKPSNPTDVSSGGLTLGGDIYPTSIYVSGRYAYIGGEDSVTLQVIDVSNPAKPQDLTSGGVATSSAPTSIFVQGRYAYITEYSSLGGSAFQVFDVNNPASPTSVYTNSSIVTQPESVYVQGRYAYVLSNTKLQVLDISNPSSPSDVSSGGVSTNGQSVFVQGRYAYVANYSTSKLQVFNVSDPTSPSDISSGGASTGSHPYSVFVSGRYAYVANTSANTLQTFDLGGAYAQQLEAGGAELGTLQVDSNASFAADASIQGGLQIGQSLQVGSNIGTAGSVALGTSLVFGNSSNANTVTLSAGTTSSSYSLSLPTSAPSTSQCLQTDSVDATKLVFVGCTGGSGSGVTAVGAIDGGTYSDNGAYINNTTNTIYLQSATASHTGLVTHSGSQTFGGNKTFSGTATVDTSSSTAFVIQNTSSNKLLTADTSAMRISIGSIGTATGQLYVAGQVPVDVSSGGVTTGTEPQSVFVQGRYAYVVDYSANLFQIFDISNPASPTDLTAGGVSTGAGSNPFAVSVSGHYAYIADYTSNKLQVFDVSDPTSPTDVSSGGATTGSGPSSVYVQGHYAYVVNYTSNTIQAFDVTNPAVPVDVSSGGTSTGSGSHPWTVYVQGHYAYVTDSGTNKLQIFDISDPTTPTDVSSGGATTGGAPQSIYVSGRYAYVADHTANKLQVFDISDPTTPTDVSSGGASTGSYPISVYVQGRYAYVADYTGSKLQVFDISDPTTPTDVSSGGATAGGGPASLFVSGRYAYVADYDTNKLQVFDLGGAYSQQLEAGGAQVGTLAVDGNSSLAGDASIRGGLTVGQGLQVTGSISGGQTELQTSSGAQLTLAQSASNSTTLQTDSSGNFTLTSSGQTITVQSSATVTTLVNDDFTAATPDSAWTLYGGNTLPAAATSTYDSTGTGHWYLGLNTSGSGYDCWNTMYACIPVLRSYTNVDRTYEVKIDSMNLNSGSGHSESVGLMLYDSSGTTNTFIRFEFHSTTSGIYATCYPIINNVGSTTACSSVAFTPGTSNYIRVVNTGSNFYEYVSTDGTDWTLVNNLYQTGFTVTQAGFYVDKGTSTNAVNANFDYFKSTALTNPVTLQVNGNIAAEGAVTTGADYAEYYKQAVPGQLTVGDLACLAGPQTVAACGPGGTVVGAVSARPGYIGNSRAYDKNHPENTALVGMMGQIPVKYDTSGGAINVGDPIGISTTSGVATKEVGAGQIVGYALENSSDASGGTIMVLVRPQYYTPANSAALQGGNALFNNMAISGTATFAGDINVMGTAQIGTLQVSGDATIHGKLTVSGDVTVVNLTVGGHLVTTGKAPTVTTTDGAVGHFGVVTVTGNDTTGTITIKVDIDGDGNPNISTPVDLDGDGKPDALVPLTAGQLFKITFNKPFADGSTPHILLTPANDQAAQAETYVNSAATNNSTFAVNALQPLQDGKTYVFTYLAIQ
ncbi:MAG TPA: beta-propeller fold lactonase family protein [Candidatus Saccharimonadales bacterium]|nr:beta-propeller fold lactonase family protein [Candidatus Saccharimonadales bacterium]